jgi:2-methylisocitrate lyase-like PEP mutase family enzyme
MLAACRNVHEATRALPIIGDGDTGYGSAVNVKRTVRGFASAGFAGLLIEDQVPRCDASASAHPQRNQLMRVKRHLSASHSHCAD